MDPWNNVSITFNISREAADKLKALADQQDAPLKSLGILSVQFDYADNEAAQSRSPKPAESQPADAITLPCKTHLNKQTNENVHAADAISNRQNPLLSPRVAVTTPTKSDSEPFKSPNILPPKSEDSLFVVNHRPSGTSMPTAKGISSNKLNEITINSFTKCLSGGNTLSSTNHGGSRGIQSPSVTVQQASQPSVAPFPFTSMQYASMHNKNSQQASQSQMQQQVLHPLENSATQSVSPRPFNHQVSVKSPHLSTSPVQAINRTPPRSISSGVNAIKSPYIRNPNLTNNIKLAPSFLNTSTNEQNKEARVLCTPSSGIVMSGIVHTSSPSTSSSTSNPTSNVALTSPLLVNLLQSDVSPSAPTTATIQSDFASTPTSFLSHQSSAYPNHVLGTMKEPIAKKTKAKKTRKPKDKPPDYEIASRVSPLKASESITLTSSTNMASTGIKISSTEYAKASIISTLDFQTNSECHSNRSHIDQLGGQLMQSGRNLVITSSHGDNVEISTTTRQSPHDFLSNSKSESSEPSISILPISKDVETHTLQFVTSMDDSVSIPNESRSSMSITTSSHMATLIVSSPQEAKFVSTSPARSLSTGSIHLLQKKNLDSFLNLPSPVEENKTKHLINPFTGHMEPMMSEDDEEEMTPVTQNSSVSATVTSASSTIVNGDVLKAQLESKDNPSDTDSGIGKMTNDGSSQSSAEISPSEMISSANVINSHTEYKHNELVAGDSLNKSSIGLIPTLLVDDIRPLNRVPTLTCELIGDSTVSLLGDEKLVNVNDLLSKSINVDNELGGEALDQCNFVDGMLNKSGDNLNFEKDCINSLPSDRLSSLISRPNEYTFVTHGSNKALNDERHLESLSMASEKQHSALISSLVSEQSTSVNGKCTGSMESKLINNGEPILMEPLDSLDGVQVTVQCSSAGESSSTVDELIVPPLSTLLNFPQTAKEEEHSEGEMDVEDSGEESHLVFNHSVAAGDHNYTSLKRTCNFPTNSKVCNKLKKVNS